MSIKSHIYDRLREIKVIDTHEHLWDESYRLNNPGDWTTMFFQYSITSLSVAGMNAKEEKELYAAETPHKRKWDIFSRYFPDAKNTAYIKAALYAIKDIYDIDRIDCDSMQELTMRIRASVKPGFHRKVLREMGGVDYCMVNCFDEDEYGNRNPVRYWGDIGLMKPDLWVDNFIYPKGRRLLENMTGVECLTLCGWIKAIDAYFEKYVHLCCSIKIGLAYLGPLNFSPDASFAEAEKCFDLHIKTPQSYQKVRPLTDFLFYYILKKSAEYNLTIKLHTGIYAGEDWLDYKAIGNNVRDLAGIAMAHSENRFAAMHIAYPFYDELLMAVKSLRNLYAEMSWAWIVDTESAGNFFKKALCAAPVNKVTGFGGDFAFVENTYGHLEMTRRGMASALSDMVESGYFDQDEAVFVGHSLLRYSAEKLFRNPPCPTP